MQFFTLAIGGMCTLLNNSGTVLYPVDMPEWAFMNQKSYTSVGSKGDSYDNALAESFNGLYKWELIHRQGPWRGLDDIEFATMTYVDWFNQRRLHGEITDDSSYTIPAEAEADYYRQTTPANEAATQ